MTAVAQNTLHGQAISITYSGTVKPASPIRGEMYVDLNTSTNWIYDGITWVTIHPNISTPFEFPVGPSVEELCEKHPGLKELKDELDEAQAKFDSYLILVR